MFEINKAHILSYFLVLILLILFVLEYYYPKNTENFGWKFFTASRAPPPPPPPSALSDYNKTDNKDCFNEAYSNTVPGSFMLSTISENEALTKCNTTTGCQAVAKRGNNAPWYLLNNVTPNVSGLTNMPGAACYVKKTFTPTAAVSTKSYTEYPKKDCVGGGNDNLPNGYLGTGIDPLTAKQRCDSMPNCKGVARKMAGDIVLLSNIPINPDQLPTSDFYNVSCWKQN